MKISRFILFGEKTKDNINYLYDFFSKLSEEQRYKFLDLLARLYALKKHYTKKEANVILGQIQAIDMYTNLFNEIIE